MWQISSRRSPLSPHERTVRAYRKVQRQQRFIYVVGPILLVLTLLLAAWGVIDPIGPDFNWGPMWR